MSALLTGVMLMQTASFNVASALNTFKTETVIEAEDAVVNNAMLFDYDDRASGGAYVYSRATAVSNPAQIGLEDLSWLIDVEEEGEYYLNIRTHNLTALFFRVDDGEWTRVSLNNPSDNAKWTEMGRVVLKKGVNKLKVHHSNTGGWIDAVYVTKDQTTVPELPGGAKPFKEEGSTSSLYTIVSTQKEIPTVTGSGILMEAEDATVCSPYVFASSKYASGMKGVSPKSSYSKSPGGGTQGHIEFRFNVEKTSTYSFWIRTYATATNQDSIYGAVNNKSYEFLELTISEDFVWKKLTSAELEAGTEGVFRLYAREANNIVDCIIITDKRFTPTGRTGNIPSDENVKSSISASYAKPEVNPPANQHPRVLFRESDIERIKTNMELPQNAAAKTRLLSRLALDEDGKMNNNYSSGTLATLEAYAFDYVINGNIENGQRAISGIINYLDTGSVESSNTDNITRNGGHVIYVASEIYDWCYDLLNTEQKLKIIAECEAIADIIEVGWPPTKQGSVVGHGSEAQILRCLLAFAIATYDERPDIWQVVGGRFYEQFVPARNFLNQGQYNLQGDSYGLYRHIWDSWSHILITGMGAPAPYDTEDLYKVSYGAVYMRRPDGQLLRDGDSASDTANAMWTYWSDRTQSFLLDNAIGNDPYLKDELARQSKNMAYWYDASCIVFLVTNDPEIENKSIANLPLSKTFPDPVGMTVARTGWDDGVESPSVVAQMKVGGVVVNNHQHLDAGHFQIYYKGILASDSGVYEGFDKSKSGDGTGYGTKHYNMYMTKSVAHNTMLVYDPSEGKEGVNDRGNITDGGQRAVNQGKELGKIEDVIASDAQVASVVGQEIDPKNPQTPAYTYLKGDLTNAYSDKVSDFKRSFMFFNFFDEEVPAAMIVFDKVTSSNSSFKKTWLLHGLEEPEINGNQTIFRRTYASQVYANEYNGKMTVDTLLPTADNAVITKVGGVGEDGWSVAGGVDYKGIPANTASDEGQTWRIELSPKNNANTDYFLNVIQVSDNDKNYYLTPEIIETDNYYGAQISDRVVMFSKSGEREKGMISFTNPSNAPTQYTICDAISGTWEITTSDGVQNVYVSEEGGVIAVKAAGGSFSAKYIGTENTAPAIEVQEALPEIKSQLLKIDNFYVYNKDRMKIVEGTSLLDMDTFKKYLNVDYQVSGNTVYATRSGKTVTMSIGSNIAYADGAEVAFPQSVHMENGKIFVPIKGLSQLFDIEVDWDGYTRTVFLTSPLDSYELPKEGYAQYAKVTPDDGAVDGSNVAENSIDGDYDSIWAALGVGRYLDFEFDKAYTLTSAEVLFNPNSSRNARFAIQVSSDGVNFTTVYEGIGDGSLEKPVWEKFDFEAPVTVKYARFVANGSNLSEWNAIKEIRFKTN